MQDTDMRAMVKKRFIAEVHRVEGGDGGALAREYRGERGKGEWRSVAQ